jgi:hypothetical protein
MDRSGLAGSLPRTRLREKKCDREVKYDAGSYPRVWVPRFYPASGNAPLELGLVYFPNLGNMQDSKFIYKPLKDITTLGFYGVVRCVIFFNELW